MNTTKQQLTALVKALHRVPAEQTVEILETEVHGEKVLVVKADDPEDYRGGEKPLMWIVTSQGVVPL